MTLSVVMHILHIRAVVRFVHILCIYINNSFFLRCVHTLILPTSTSLYFRRCVYMLILPTSTRCVDVHILPISTSLCEDTHTSYQYFVLGWCRYFLPVICFVEIHILPISTSVCWHSHASYQFFVMWICTYFHLLPLLHLWIYTCLLPHSCCTYAFMDWI